MRHLLSICLTGLLLCGLVSGQTTSSRPGPQQAPLRIGLGLFGAALSGDINDNGEEFYRFYPGVNLSLQFANKKLISPQLTAGFGKFVAQNRDLGEVEGIRPNTFVETPFFFADLRFKARFLRQKGFQPYLSAGIGLLGYTPKDAEGNPLLDNFPTRKETETYGSVTASFPLSIGFEVRMSPILTLGTEYTYRPSGSDYLDNIGELGTRSGNDRINTFALNLFITFDPENPVNFRNLKGRERRD